MKKILRILLYVLLLWVSISLIVAAYAAIFLDNKQAQEDLLKIGIALLTVFTISLLRRIFSESSYNRIRLGVYLFGYLAAVAISIVIMFSISAVFGTFLLFILTTAILFSFVFRKWIIQNKYRIAVIELMFGFID